MRDRWDEEKVTLDLDADNHALSLAGESLMTSRKSLRQFEPQFSTEW